MAKAKDTASAVKDYRVLTALNHDNEDFAPVDAVSLTDKQALPLLAIGAIAAPDAPAAPEAGKGGQGG
jgi:hypothetical protein